MKPAEKQIEPSEDFDLSYQRDSLTVYCQSPLGSWNLKEFKAIIADAILFQPIQNLFLDLNSQPVEAHAFQAVVQAAQAMALLGKKLYALNSTTEFNRSVGANGLYSVIHINAEGGELAAIDPKNADQCFPAETRILVVDDIQSVRSLLCTYLSELGYSNVVQARSGEDALNQLLSAAGSDSPFQIVISDWYMPSMSGLDLHRKVREHEALKPVVFVLITVETEKANVLKAFQQGVRYYLVKPFRMQTIQEKLREIWTKERRS